MNRKDKIGWVGTSLTLTGVSMQTLLPATLAWTFPVFLIAAIGWFTNACMERNRPHMSLQLVLMTLNAIGTYRYLLT